MGLLRGESDHRWGVIGNYADFCGWWSGSPAGTSKALWRHSSLTPRKEGSRGTEGTSTRPESLVDPKRRASHNGSIDCDVQVAPCAQRRGIDVVDVLAGADAEIRSVIRRDAVGILGDGTGVGAGHAGYRDGCRWKLAGRSRIEAGGIHGQSELDRDHAVSFENAGAVRIHRRLHRREVDG